MSKVQRIIVRQGIEAQIPTLKFGELGMDTDTKTLRLGDDTPVPLKIMGTKSTGDFDFSSTGTVTFNNIVFKPGGGIGGADFDQLIGGEGIVVSLGGGNFRQTKIISSDGSVIVSNGDGQAGEVDLRISTESLSNALADIRNSITSLQEQVTIISNSFEDRDDSILKLAQLTGMPEKSVDLGDFLGNTIPDDSTIRTALQALETAVELALGANVYHLEIVGHDDVKLGLMLTPDNIVVLEGATPDLAGLMVGADKFKLDFITATQPVDLDTVGITSIVAYDNHLDLIQENGDHAIIQFPLVDPTHAGAMSPGDKIKVDFITTTAAHDLDDFETRIAALESNANHPYLVMANNTDIWISDVLVSTTFNMPLDNLAIDGYAVIFERAMEGYESRFYDAIVLNDIEIVPAENITKSYSSAVQLFRIKNGDWYFVDSNKLPRKFADAATTTVILDCGAENAVRVQEMVVL